MLSAAAPKLRATKSVMRTMIAAVGVAATGEHFQKRLSAEVNV
jgi:hypothetical protein